MVIVVMGVAGAGKTTVGRALAAELGWTFRDADELHTPDNIARMQRGEPLGDEHRLPWLDALAALIAEHVRTQRPLVLACSALRASYRAELVSDVVDCDAVRIVHLHATPELLAQRIAARTGHFFPASLLATQLAALEPPQPDEPVPIVTVDASLPAGVLVQRIRDALQL